MGAAKEIMQNRAGIDQQVETGRDHQCRNGNDQDTKLYVLCQ